MAKKLYADGNTGDVAICEADANLSDPLGDLDNIYFHSDFNYLHIKKTGTIELSFPSIGKWGGEEEIIQAHLHDLGYVPVMFAIFVSPSGLESLPLAGEFIVQTAGDTGRRSLMVGADSQYIYIRKFDISAEASIPSFDCIIKYFLMGEA